ncbi:MAG: hypothetical protein GY796_02570, partial [Chloroflexi bacterium]|nr:hypothetical protein [Chloroflexota bacterium]
LQIQTSGGSDVYRGVDLDTNSSSSNLGSTAVSVKAVDLATEFCTVDGAASPDYAGRCYSITPTNNLAANVTLWALTSEVPSRVTTPSAYHFSGGAWQELSGITRGTNASYTWVNGDTSGFSSFLMADRGSAPTAVSLQSIYADADTAALPVVMVLFLLTAVSGLAFWQRRTLHGHNRRKR